MIDQKEIQRVRQIHTHLDRAAAEMRPGYGYLWLHIRVNGVTTTYTADEVRRWPEMKAKMEERLKNQREWRYSFVAIGDDWNEGLFSCEQEYKTMPDEVVDNSRRGLCMYREMLEPKRDTIPVLRGIDPAEDAPGEFKEMAKRINDTLARIAASFDETAKRLNEKKPDPYRGHDLATERTVAALTYEHPTNVRARKVAQLRAELDRPLPHPVEARSERALPVSNSPRVKL